METTYSGSKDEACLVVEKHQRDTETSKCSQGSDLVAWILCSQEDGQISMEITVDCNSQNQLDGSMDTETQTEDIPEDLRDILLDFCELIEDLDLYYNILRGDDVGNMDFDE